MLAANKARSSWSNTREFLRPSKRPKLNHSNEEHSADTTLLNELGSSSSARTSAIKVDRDVQMKYDTAKNPDGPLGRTMQGESQKLDARAAPGQGSGGVISDMLTTALASPRTPTLARHPGFQERFANVEKHLKIQWSTNMTFHFW